MRPFGLVLNAFREADVGPVFRTFIARVYVVASSRSGGEDPHAKPLKFLTVPISAVETPHLRQW